MRNHRTKGSNALVMTAAAVTLLAIGATGFHYVQDAQASTDKTSVQPTAPNVDVAIMNPESIRLWSEFSGRLQPVEFVQIRPQVSGTLVEILFREGALVKAGEPLYVIDPRPFEAEVASARAALKSARSRGEFARVELQRFKGLENRKVISVSQFDSVNNDYRVAQADESAAQAALERALLNLEYAHIKAPIGGHISRSEITRGNLVEGGTNGPVLASIVSSEKVYGEFDVDEQTYLTLMRAQSTEPMVVTLSLAGDDEAVYQGRLHAFDNQLSSTSGTIRARALFDNSDGVLVPGMFARIRVAAPVQDQALLIEERAVGTNQSQKFVYVVGDDNVVAYREVTLGAGVDGRRVVHRGLVAGEKVMVNSLQRVMPGMTVAPVAVAQLRTAPQDSDVAYKL